MKRNLERSRGENTYGGTRIRIIMNILLEAVQARNGTTGHPNAKNK